MLSVDHPERSGNRITDVDSAFAYEGFAITG